MLIGGAMPEDWCCALTMKPWVKAAALIAWWMLPSGSASAIDFYEIQIYTVETAPKGRVELELHSNSVTTATGQWAHQTIDPYQIHETLEGTYGVLEHLEVGQYFATGKLSDGNYEYAGSRSKMHFGIGDPDRWIMAFGGNIELDYMRRQAEDNPLNLELRPILESHFGNVAVVANLAFEKPFSGPQTHEGMQFDPSGEIVYNGLFEAFSPALEYYGDMGPIQPMPSISKQQHFLVPALNLNLDPRLEVNLGVGFGLTRASNGAFIKSILGWTF
jgi:hypothetical protein